MRASHLSHLHSPSKGKNEEKNLSSIYFMEASLVAQRVKRLPAMQKTQVQSLGGEDPLEKEMAATPVFLPGKSHGSQSLVGYRPWSLVGYRPWGHKELDTTERLHFHFHFHFTPWKESYD